MLGSLGYHRYDLLESTTVHDTRSMTYLKIHHPHVAIDWTYLKVLQLLLLEI